MKPLEKIEYKGYTINVHHDIDPQSPREWDNLGTIVCFSKRYILGDKHNHQCPEYFLDDMKDSAYIFPVYMMDHGNISLSRSDFNDQWDSGMIGFIYVTHDRAYLEYPNMIDGERAIACFKQCKAEIETYSQYLRGEVYGHIITDSEGNEADSCWGYYDIESMISDCKNVIDFVVEKERKEKQTILKGYIYNKVSLIYRWR